MEVKLRSKWKWGVASETRRGLMLGMGYTEEELERPLVAVVNSWNEYTIALTLISSDILKPITVGINVFYGFNIIKWQYLFATSVFATIPVIILFLCIEKHLVSGLTAGGVKG